MNILLTQHFEAHDPRTSIALLDLATYARKHGHSVSLAYDDQLPPLNEYDTVGYSAMTLNANILDRIRGLRTRYEGRFIVGGKATDGMALTDRVALQAMDIEVVVGPGEPVFSSGEALDYKTYPAWSWRDFQAMDRTQAVAEAMSSRGCPYHCHFCHNTEPKVRFFSPERTVENAHLILERAGRSRVFFVDDIFALRPDRMTAILQAADHIGLELRKRSCFFIHVNHLKPDVLDAIDALQPTEMQMGVESGDDEMLQAMGKTFTAADAEQKLRELHGRGRQVACLFLMGFPGESRGSLRATVDFATRNRQYMSGWWVSYYQPVRGSKGWEMAKERCGKRVDGTVNTEITYLDPNLTVDDLTSARQAIMG